MNENLTASEADYVIKKGNTVLSVASVKVADNKKTATLVMSSSTLAAGEYSIVFNEKDKYSFNVAAEVITSMEVVGTDLILDAGKTGAKGDTASISYKVLNQFGEQMKGQPNVTCSLAVTTPASVTAATRDAAGKITVELDNAALIGSTTGSLVLVDTTTGVSKAVTVTVNSSSTISKVDVLGVYDITDTENAKVATIETGDDASDYAVVLKAYDQYGNAFTALNGLTSKESGKTANITVSVAGTDQNLAIAANDWSTNTITIDGEDYLYIPFAAKTLTTAGTNTVTIVGNAIGLLASVSVNITQAVDLASVSLSFDNTLYEGTKTEVAYTAVDTAGNAVTDYSKLSAVKFAVSEDGDAIAFEQQSDGSAKLFITPGKTDITKTSSRAVVVTTTVGNFVDVKTTKAYAAKTPAVITGLSSTAAKATVLGETLSISQKDLVVIDQYGNALSEDEIAGMEGYSVKAAVEANGTGFESYGGKTTAFASNKDQDMLAAVASSETAGTSNFTFTLLNSSTEVENSSYTVKLQSVAMDSIKTYTLSEIPTLYSGTASSSAIVPVEITGKVGSVVVAVPTGSYIMVANDYVTRNADGTITANKELFEDANTTKEVDLEFVINNTEGTSLVKTVTISNVDPKIATVERNDKELAAVTAGAINVVATAGAVTELFDVKNQYDNYVTTSETASTPRIKFTNLPDGFTVDSNNTTTATLKTAAKVEKGSYTVTVTVTYPSGVTATETLAIDVVEAK